MDHAERAVPIHLDQYVLRLLQISDHLSCRDDASVRADGRHETARMLERVRDHVGSLPYMRWHQARKIAALLSEHDLRDCLELGFFHGVSSAYIAQILKDRGGGHLTTIDRSSARYRKPNIEQLLSDLDLTSFVTVYYEDISYTWRLMNLVENNGTPIFDFCYIDGGHTWDDTGFAIFLVERLLRPDGWLLLDDLDWTLEQMPTLPTDKTREEMTTPQVRKVWELLVKRHPAFHNFREAGSWGYAQKR